MTKFEKYELSVFSGRKKVKMNVVISKGVLHPRDLQNRIFLELVMIMTWYLGWGNFRAWKTFSEFLVNRCWLNFDIGCLICQNLPKNAKKGNCWLKTRGVSVISCLQPWYLGEKWPKGYITTYENNYSHIYGPLENIDISVLVIFINFEQFWQKR